MEEDNNAREHDDIRCQSAVQTIVDVLMRFEETSEGSYTLYDLMSYAMEDLIREGYCAACFQEALQAACRDLGVDPTEHKPEGAGTVH